MNYIYIFSVPTQLGGGGLLRNSAIFEVPSYFLGTDDDGTSRSLCIVIGSIGVGILVMINEQCGAVIDQCFQFTCLTRLNKVLRHQSDPPLNIVPTLMILSTPPI